MPRLSIVVPIYNVAQYLRRCLDSIAAQDYRDFEVILVDDGSTDESGAIAEEYACSYDNFRITHKSNGGLMDAWMKGVEISNGEYIGFVDSDDWIDPDMFSSLMLPVEKYCVDIALCNHWYETGSGSNEWTIHINPIEGGLFVGGRLEEIRGKMFPRLGYDYISPSRWSKVVRKSLLTTCERYCDRRISSAEDVNSMVPCLLHCESLFYVDRPLYRYCKNEKSISHVYKNEILDTYVVLVDALCRALGDTGKEIQGFENELWNFYGVAWCLYVMRSDMSMSEKRNAIRRLQSCGGFAASAGLIGAESGMTARIYRAMMRSNCPELFLAARGLMGRIRGC